MKYERDIEKNTPQKSRKWSAALWFKLILFNLFGLFLIAWIFHGLGSMEPFKYAIITSVGIFMLSVIIVSNVKRAKRKSKYTGWK